MPSYPQLETLTARTQNAPAFFAQRPAPEEGHVYYHRYTSLVPEGNVLHTLAAQHAETQNALRGLTETQALFRPAPAEWSIKQVVGHLLDVERIFTHRLMCFARAEAAPLHSMDQEAYVAAAQFDAVPVADLLDEFLALRLATLYLIMGLDEAAWNRSGTASGYFVTVRALGWMVTGHELHHMLSLREKYLPFA